MAFEALLIGPCRRRLSLFFYPRVLFQQAVPCIIFLCILLCVAACAPYTTNEVQQLVGCDTRDPCRDDHVAGFEDIYGGESSSGYFSGDSVGSLELENVCTNTHLFCFPSTLLDGLSQAHKIKASVLEVSRSESDVRLPAGSSQFHGIVNSSLSANHGVYKLSNGRSVFCSLKSGDGIHYMTSLWAHSFSQNDLSSYGESILNEKIRSPALNGNSRIVGFNFVDGSSNFVDGFSPHVDITPTVLDWGQKYLYFPSSAYLTVFNTCNHSKLHVYEPFSTNTQFYSCNNSEFSLGPGEAASICFVFLPTLLGSSLAYLVLQTSSGGFLVQAKGIAMESPYGLRSLVGLDVFSDNRLSRNLSLFNPYNEVLYVEEVTVWIVVSSENNSHTTGGSCSLQLKDFHGPDEYSLLSSEDQLRNGGWDLPLTSMKPYRNWEVRPQSSETIMEIDFPIDSVGNVIGALYLKLLRPSQDEVDRVMVPLEAFIKKGVNNSPDAVPVFLEALVPCDSNETLVFAISIQNFTPFLLTIIKIIEVTENEDLFQIKYVERLIVFPQTVTKVALITSRVPNIFSVLENSCSFRIMTNDSNNPLIEIPCEDIVRSCSGHQQNSANGYVYRSKTAGFRTGSLGRSDNIRLPSKPKVLEVAEADEMVLGNWRSHGSASGISVLDDREVLFPIVQVGSHHSKWITVKNPTQQPVVMQLILNSGEIIDDCRSPDGLLQPPSSAPVIRNEYTSPIKYGFSVPESPLTEVYVHPYGRAFVGPILFHPSSRCGWRTSALIRNNLSGVEWLTLRGFGGFLSLLLLEGSESIKRIEFKLNIPVPLNFSAPDGSTSREKYVSGCLQPLVKELYARNTGDLPLVVRKIDVSGTSCSLDGFTVHTCKGFTLDPGESITLLVSYQADFSAAVVSRDLELVMATGILVTPMKATLPLYMLNFCEKSVFWMRVKKFSLAFVPVAASLMLLVCCCLLSQIMSVCSENNLFKREDCFTASGTNPVHFSHVRRNDVDGNSKQGLSSQYGKPSSNNYGKGGSDVIDERESSSPMLSKAVDIESSGALEASPGSLIVRIEKEKRKRRRKRKGAGAGLTGLSEVCSSHSGNSTPSSPLSPVTSTPKQTWSLSPEKDQPVEARNPFSKMANQEFEKCQYQPASKPNRVEPIITMKSRSSCFSPIPNQPSVSSSIGKPVLMPSSTFPSASRPSLQIPSPSAFVASSPSIASYARAPGSKFCNDKTLQKARHDNEFTYDIWGDHIFGLHMGKPTEPSAMSSSATESNSDSFFASGPQALGIKTQVRSAMASQAGCRRANENESSVEMLIRGVENVQSIYGRYCT